MGLNDLTEKIIGAAIDVHRRPREVPPLRVSRSASDGGELGPGLLESTYEACMVFELAERGIGVDRQKALPVVYRGVRIDCGYRIDLLVEDLVIVELKAVAELQPIHEAQLLSYLKLSGRHVGLLINFNVKLLKRGIRRLVNELPE
jgi:GxxExxY protein